MAANIEYDRAIKLQRDNMTMDARPVVALEQIADQLFNIADELSAIRQMLKAQGGGIRPPAGGYR